MQLVDAVCSTSESGLKKGRMILILITVLIAVTFNVGSRGCGGSTAYAEGSRGKTKYFNGIDWEAMIKTPQDRAEYEAIIQERASEHRANLVKLRQFPGFVKGMDFAENAEVGQLDHHLLSVCEAGKIGSVNVLIGKGNIIQSGSANPSSLQVLKAESVILPPSDASSNFIYSYTVKVTNISSYSCESIPTLKWFDRSGSLVEAIPGFIEAYNPDSRMTLFPNDTGIIAACSYGEMEDAGRIAAFVVDFRITKIGGKNVGKPKVSKANWPTPRDAYIVSQQFVEEKLISPSSADFPWRGTNEVLREDGSFLIHSYVDSDNAFGANVRTNYECILRFRGGDWYDYRNWDVESFTFF